MPPAEEGSRDDVPVACFDFDGTITRIDSLPLFALWLSPVRSFQALVHLVTAAVRGRLRSRDAAKRLFVDVVFAGMSSERVRHRAESFARFIFPLIRRRRLVDRLTAHLADGDRVIIVSASLECWVAPCAEKLGISEVVSTRAEVHMDGRFTGRLSMPNCRGQEKVTRLDEYLGRRPSVLHAYGNSTGDDELLGIATHPHRISRRPVSRVNTVVQPPG